MSDSVEVEAIYQGILEAVENQALPLPTLPDTAVLVAKAVQDERRRISDVARIIQADVGITARLIRIANSPLYRGVTPVANCQAAVTRLGLAVTRNLVTSFALRPLFHSPSRWLKGHLDAAWEQSTRVGAISFVLGRVTLRLDPDRAMLAGLVHNIGALPALWYLDRYPKLRPKNIAFQMLLSRICAPLGARILSAWQFDDELVRVVTESEDWYRDPAPLPDYCDVVLVAKLHSRFGKVPVHTLPKFEDVPAFRKFAVFTLGPSSSIELLREAEQDIVEVQSILDQPN